MERRLDCLRNWTSQMTFRTLLTALCVIHCLTNSADAQQSSIADVIAAQQPVVVKLFGAGAGTLDSYGSGIIVSSEGHVLTVWNHLVSTGFLTAVTFNGRKFAVDIVGTSAEHDVALLKLKADPGDSFAFVDVSRAVDPEIGSAVFAFSNMFRVAAGNEPVSLMHGVIAAKVPLEATQGRWKFPLKSPVWLIDAITNNSGAAGGLLTDTSGAPVGLIGREIRHTASRTWVNYAVPLTTLRPVVESLRAGKRVDSRPKDAAENVATISDQELTIRFGLTMLPNVVERTPAWIDAIAEDSIAANAGLQRGDLIVLLEDVVITSVTDFQQHLATYRSRQRVSVTVNREQELIAIELKIP